LVAAVVRAHTGDQVLRAVLFTASKIGFGKYIRLEEMGTIGGATGADSREK
jgi:hypothetical protein